MRAKRGIATVLSYLKKLLAKSASRAVLAGPRRQGFSERKGVASRDAR
jgi:hypothetical protein